jgi:hypothetical protein
VLLLATLTLTLQTRTQADLRLLTQGRSFPPFPA